MYRYKCDKLERYVYSKEVLKTRDKNWFENEFRSLTMELIERANQTTLFSSENEELFYEKKENELEIRRRIMQLTNFLLEKNFD